METVILLATAGVMVFVVLYAQRQIAYFTQGSTNIFIARSLLLLVGAMFGWISASDTGSPLVMLLRFLIGLGMVHVPAAVILFIKSRRGAGKS